METERENMNAIELKQDLELLKIAKQGNFFCTIETICAKYPGQIVLRHDSVDMAIATLGRMLFEAKHEPIEALRFLYDEQNGPPLLRRAKQWQAAMDLAAEILKDAP